MNIKNRKAAIWLSRYILYGILFFIIAYFAPISGALSAKSNLSLPLINENLIPKKKASLNEKNLNRNEVNENLKPWKGQPTEKLTIQIHGQVTSDESGSGLPGVNVVVKGTTIGTITDVEGNYSLEVPSEESVLVFSSIGFTKVEVVVGNQTEINVVMKGDINQLEEVVVVGYGTQMKSDVTGAISSVSSKDLGKTISSNVMEQAQGRLAGVDIVRSSGNPGADVQIRIRGNRSITAGNDPLFVFDGIPTNLGINDFNPNDIESIEVLKDASAVAIYGSRGANGVILITTKKGKVGEVGISYVGSYAFKKPFENIDTMNPQEFAKYVRIANGLDPDDISQDDEILTSVENLQSGIDPNWVDLGYGSGLQQEHQLSVSGGSEKIIYYVSGSYLDEQGIVSHGSDFSRYSIRANIEAKLKENLTIGLSSMATKSVQNLMSGTLYSNLISNSPLAHPYDSEGNIIQYPNPNVERVNSMYFLEPNQYIDELKSMRIFANIFAEYKLHKSLTYRMNFGPDYRSSRRGQYEGLLLGEGINTASINNIFDFSYTLENILTFNKELGEHSLNIVGLFSLQESSTESSSATGRNLPIEKSKYYDIGSANDILSINSSLSEWGLLSYMGRINYKFKNRYLITASGRADGSSRLAEGNKWAFFPAAAFGWIVSEESFYNNSFLNFLKLRMGYGEVGNTSISPYQTLGGLGNSNYAFGNSQAFGFGLQVIPNPDLGWEISKTVNVGLDFGLFNDRISGAIELYDTKTKNLLLNRFLPITSGYSSILQNIGSTRNRGWEFSASAFIIQSADGFNWDIDLNVFSNKEEITELYGAKNDDVGNRWFIGEPINVFYSYKQVGIWQEGEATEAAEYGQAPGDIKIGDVNGRDEKGNLTKHPDGQINADDRTVLGSTVPNWSGGITNRFNYKGFDLSFLIYARQGQMLYSYFHEMGGNDWQGRHGKINLNYWTPDNPSNEIPIPRAEKSPLYGDAVMYFDASFVKIKNISLSYTLDNEPIKQLGLGLSSVRIFTTVNNADELTISKFKIVDPETANGYVGEGNPLKTTSIIFGLNVRF